MVKVEVGTVVKDAGATAGVAKVGMTDVEDADAEEEEEEEEEEDEAEEEDDEE